MTVLSPSRRIAFAVLGIVSLLLTTAGCGSDSGGNEPSGDVRAVLGAAKKKFDETASVHFTMATKSVPSRGNAVLGADGTLTHQPAFKGEVRVLFSGFTTSIPVVSVDGKVHAKLPLTPAFATIDPGEYGAPDPADFADAEEGISGLLTQLGGPKKSGESRVGKQVVTTYTGGLPGGVVSRIIPSAAKTSDYAVVVGIDEDGRLATLKVTGDFFSGSGDVTYNLTFDSYGKNVTISAP
jgi:lipoprotein LprG